MHETHVDSITNQSPTVRLIIARPTIWGRDEDDDQGDWIDGWSPLLYWSEVCTSDWCRFREHVLIILTYTLIRSLYPYSHPFHSLNHFLIDAIEFTSISIIFDALIRFDDAAAAASFVEHRSGGKLESEVSLINGEWIEWMVVVNMGYKEHSEIKIGIIKGNRREREDRRMINGILLLIHFIHPSVDSLTHSILWKKIFPIYLLPLLRESIRG